MSLPAATVRYLSGLGPGDAGPPDADLLGWFVDRRDDAAFALLVRRHGDMVYGVCRRLLPTAQDAEDAFQATFLVLARKAGTVAPRGAVGNWLYGVARRAALLARRAIARRRERVAELTDVPAPPPDPLAELRAVLDAEVSRLADALRTVVVLCDLEGRTRKEAAAILGWPEGTVAGRLAQAHRLLAKRLARHAPAVSVAAALSATAARAPAAVFALTSPDGRVVPASVAALTRAVLANLAGGRLMKTVIAVLVLGCAGLGMSLGAGQDRGSSPMPNASGNAVAAAEKPVNADPVVFWGKEVGGLQAGLSLVETKTEQAGDTTRLTVKLDVKVRNVGKAPVTITYGSPWERAPTITDAAGKEVPIRHSDFWIAPILLRRDRVIEPGKTFSLSHPEFTLEVDAKQPVPKDIPERTVRVRPGAYTISYDWVADSHEELATGGLPFKVVDPERVAKGAREDDKVAWGKEVGGLQAGLALKDARAYRYGDTIKPEVRIRNVGKEKVTITYRLLEECPPVVTGPRDARMTVAMPPPLDYYAAPMYRVLKSGETITLYNPAVEVQPTDRLTADGELRVNTPTTYVPPGMYKIEYGGMIQSHPALATGTAEFRVVDPEKDPKADLEDGRAESVTAWGKQVSGLQAGLRSPTRVLGRGESVEVELVLRNAGTSAVVLEYPTDFVLDGTPDRGRLRLKWGSQNKTLRQAETSIRPGEVVVRGRVTLASDTAGAPGTGAVRLAPGTYRVSMPAVGGVGDRLSYGRRSKGAGGQPGDPEWIDLPDLGTGVLEVTVTDREPPARGGVGPPTPQGKKEADGVTAWGKEVDGLQAGLALKDARPYRQGERVTVVVRVRNIGKEEAKFRYCRETYFEIPPTVTDGKGEPVALERRQATGFAALVPVNLAPGKEVEVGERQLELKPTLFGPGKYSVWYEQLETPENDKTLSKLATGKLELEVRETKEAQRPAAPRGKKEAEGLTAWGKEVGGLQAGLSLRPGGEYASETSTLVVRVRNVGKETVKFSYLQPFVEHSFTVTGSGGKPIPQPKTLADIGERNAGVVELAPGKEIVLHEFRRRFVQAGDGVSEDAWKKPDAIYWGTGKIGIRYEEVFGTPDMGLPGWKLDPALGKLSTGTLETTVTDAGKVDDPDDGPGGTVYRYFMAAVAGRIDDAVALAVKGSSPARREKIEDLAKQIKVIRRPTVHAAEDEALVVSEVMKFAKPQPDGAGQVFLVFTVVKSGGVWLVKDFDTTNLDGVIARVWKIKTAGPVAPPLPPDDRALATVTKLGGRYERDGKEAAGPVVLVSLGNTKVVDADLKALATLTGVETLNLSCTGVTDAGLGELAPLKNLRTLYLGNVPITDRSLKELAGFKKLTALYVESPTVTDAGLKELAALPALETLHLGGPRVTDAGVEHLAALKGLKVLSVRRTAITPAGVKVLRGALPACAVAD